MVSLASTLGGLVVSGFDTRSAWASISSGQRHLERVRRRVMTLRRSIRRPIQAAPGCGEEKPRMGAGVRCQAAAVVTTVSRCDTRPVAVPWQPSHRPMAVAGAWPLRDARRIARPTPPH